MCLPNIFSLITKLQDIVYTIYLFFYKYWNLYISYGYRLLLFHSKSSFFHDVSFFFHCNFSNNFIFVLSFSLFDGLHSIFSVSRVGVDNGSGCGWHISGTSLVSTTSCFIAISRIECIFSCHFCSHRKQYQNPPYSSHHNIHPTEIFWKKHSINVLTNLCISFEMLLQPLEMFVVFNNKIIGNFRCTLLFQWQFV